MYSGTVDTSPINDQRSREIHANGQNGGQSQQCTRRHAMRSAANAAFIPAPVRGGGSEGVFAMNMGSPPRDPIETGVSKRVRSITALADEILLQINAAQGATLSPWSTALLCVYFYSISRSPRRFGGIAY